MSRKIIMLCVALLLAVVFFTGCARPGESAAWTTARETSTLKIERDGCRSLRVSDLAGGAVYIFTSRRERIRKNDPEDQRLHDQAVPIVNTETVQIMTARGYVFVTDCSGTTYCIKTSSR